MMKKGRGLYLFLLFLLTFTLTNCDMLSGVFGEEESEDEIVEGEYAITETQINMAFTIAGDGQGGNTDADGADARFFQPYDVVLGPDNQLYVVDAGNNAIRKIDLNDADFAVTTVAGGTAGIQDGEGTEAQFQFPVSIDFDGDHTLYVADRDGGRIRKIDIDDNYTVTTIIGGGSGNKTGDALSADYDYMKAICVDRSTSEIIFADSTTQSYPGTGDIYKLYENQGGTWEVGRVSTHTTATNLYFESNQQIIITDHHAFYSGTNESATINPTPPTNSIFTYNNFGTFYLTKQTRTSNGEEPADSIWMKDLDDSSPVLLAGNGYSTGFLDGVGTAARFDNPKGLALSPDGNYLFVADMENHAIRCIVVGNVD